MRAEDGWVEPWRAVAHRGALAMTILTPRRATLDHVPMHRDATLVGFVLPDDGPSFHLSFVDAQALREWITELEPRAISVRGVSVQDERAMQQLVWQDGGDGVIEMLHWRTNDEVEH
jgi:hypothetical protein